MSGLVTTQRLVAPRPDTGALGIYARSSAPGSRARGNKLGATRGVRARLSRIVKRLRHKKGMPMEAQERVCRCMSGRTAPTVEVRRNVVTGRAHFRGIETCSNVWLCPVCSGRITEQRRVELQRAVTSWVEQGGEVYLVTMTFPHVRRDRLVDLMGRLRKALRRFNACKAYKAARRDTGHAGSVRALEVTWGAWHGWHPHVHVLWFGKPGQVERLRKLEGAWIETLMKVRLADRSQLNDMLQAAFDVQNGDYAAEYIAKFGHEPSFRSQAMAGETWGVAREMVKGAAKVGRRLTGVTPFTLLAVVAGMSEVRGLDAGQAAALFYEFADAFKNERQLYWSPRLRQALGMGKLFSDEELAELEDQQQETVTDWSFTKEDWRLVVAHNAQPDVQDASERAGADGVRALLAELRARPPIAPPPPELTEPRERWPSERAIERMRVEAGSPYSLPSYYVGGIGARA